MSRNIDRRTLIGAGAAALAAGLTAQSQAQQQPAAGIRIVALSCSPRKGKTTAAALQIALAAAKEASPNIDIELIELAGLRIGGSMVPSGVADAPDDFPALADKLADPKVAGIIVGTPVYLSGMSSLCKTFLDRSVMLRGRNFALRDKVAGALAVGGVRNGGQELAIAAIHAALLCHDMIIVGDGKPTAHQGATLLNDGKDDIAADAFGIATAKGLGKRVAEVATRLAR